MIAIKNADGTLVPVADGFAGDQRTVALSLVHSNQKRAEIQLYEVDPVPDGEHPQLQEGQEPFGVLVLKKLPDNPFGEAEISATIKVDAESNVHVEAVADGIKPVSGVFHYAGNNASQLSDAGPDAREESLPGLEFEIEEPAPVSSRIILPSDDAFTFEDESPHDPLPVAAKTMAMDDDPLGFDSDSLGLYDDPLGLDDFDAPPEPEDASFEDSRPAIEPETADAFKLDDDAVPDMDFALEEPGLEQADDLFGGFDEPPGTEDEALASLVTDEAFDFDESLADVAPAAEAPVLPDTDSFIDDPDDMDWGFDELAEPGEEKTPVSDTGQSPALPDMDFNEPSLSLEDDFDAPLESPPTYDYQAESVPSPTKPEKPRKAAHEPKPAKHKMPLAGTPRPAGITMPGLMKASIALFAVSLLEIGAYIALRFSLFP